MSGRDPIIEEIYIVREKLAREADYDMEKLFEAARARQAEGELPAVRLPPKSPYISRRSTRAKR